MPPTCYDAARAQKNAGPPPDNSQYSKYEPPVFFFTNPPEHRPAVFSVCSRPFRYPEDPTWHRPSGYWSATRIQETCDGLRRRMPDACRVIKPIVNFWDLYEYFDGYDIYHRGAQNLYNVLTHLRLENEIVQDVVEREQEAQTKQHTPLLESRVADLIGDPTMQSRLLSWDEEKQPDILKAFALSDLQRSFEDYAKYPRHLLEAIRVILRKRYNNSRNPGSVVAPTIKNAHIDVTSRLGALRNDLNNIPDDPFMAKFDLAGTLPANQIVIVNGSSATAALNAGYKPAVRASNQYQPEAIPDSAAGESRPALDVSAEDDSPCHKNDVVADLSMVERCQSAPSVIEGPEGASIDLAAIKSHLSEGDCTAWGEFQKQKKSSELKATSHDTQITTPTVMHAPESHSLSIPPVMNQSQPPMIHQNGTRQAIHYQAPSTSGVMPSPSFSPMHWLPNNSTHGEAPPASISMPPPGLRHVPLPQSPNNSARGVLNGLFANQIQPLYTTPPQWNQGLSPLMQQTTYPAPGFMQPNGAGYPMNTNPPYVQPNIGQQYVAPPLHSNGIGNSRGHQNSVSSNRVGGSWQPIGSDNIHGPKVVFLKDSVVNQSGSIKSVNQRLGNESNGVGRRTSTGGSSGYGRFNHSHTQYNGHTHPGQAGGAGVAAMRTNPRSTSVEHRPSSNGCVNAGRWAKCTKFDPCPCPNCENNDRTIYVHGFKRNALQSEAALEQLRNYFSKFGAVEKVHKIFPLTKSARVRFESVQSAIAAVQGLHDRIPALGGDFPIAEYQVGSQFYTPRLHDNHAQVSNKENHRNWNGPRDYSTVPVRREKARDGIIGKEWGPSPQIMASQNGHTSAAENSQISQPTPSTVEHIQEVQTTTEDTAANPQPEIDEQKNSSGGRHSSEHLDTNAHLNHKTAEKDEGPGQGPPKQEIQEVVQPDGSLPESQGAQPMNGQDKQVTGQAKKKKYNKNKNKNGRNQGAESLTPNVSPTTTPYEPQMNGRMLINGVEPFPPYRDTMSGPQLPIRGHSTGPGANLSISSNASTSIQDSGRKSGSLNPGAQDFVPSPSRTRASSSTLKLTPPPFPQPIPTSQVSGEASGSKTDTAPNTISQKKKNGGRVEGEIKQGGRYPKQKNGKKSQNDQKSVDTQAPADKSSDDSNVKDTAPSASVSTATLENGAAPFDRKVEMLRQDALQEAMQDELPNNSDRFLSKHLRGTETPTEEDPEPLRLPWSEKGKWKEGADPQKPRPIGSKARKDSKMDTQSSIRAESRTELDSSEATQTPQPPAPTAVSSASSSASSTTAPARTESKHRKANNYTNPKKGVGTQHPSTKTNGNHKNSNKAARAEDTTSNASSGKSHLRPKPPQAPRKTSILNAEDFPALPPSKPAPSVPRPMWPVAIPLVGPWTKNRAVSAAVSTTSSTAAVTPTTAATTTTTAAAPATSTPTTNPAVKSKEQQK
ncbi:hypothetical protein F4678DRAFT_482852 [Xylaria arbuscula]|nr:hypothetical protein F4678DRAFT_482852 [Xylaria arbuscula]